MSGLIVVEGALIFCSAGSMKIPLRVPEERIIKISNKKICVITDNLPIININSCGTCLLMSSICTPMTPIPWTTDITSRFGSSIPITENSKLMCAIGGVISISHPGQSTVSFGLNEFAWDKHAKLTGISIQRRHSSKTPVLNRGNRPIINQNNYNGRYKQRYPDTGLSICSAGATTMALRYFPGNEHISMDQIADSLIEKNYINVGQLVSDLGLQDGGKLLESFINERGGQYNVKAEYKGVDFNKNWVKSQIDTGNVFIVNVPYHFVVVSSHRDRNGVDEFYIDDSNRGHWGNSENSILDKEWISAQELESLWQGHVVIVSQK